MANVVKQFRFYSDEDSSKNQPIGSLKAAFVSGTVFENYFPILQLGIQSLPGTKFYLNNAVDPIIIGRTGIYELDLDGETEISSMRFDVTSMNNISNNMNAYLIVDIIFDNGEV